MQKNVTYILDPEDIELIKRLANNPCASCSNDTSWCCGCPKEKKYREMVKNIPEEQRETILELADAYREYIATTENINKLKENINKLKKKLEKIESEYSINKLVNFK